MKTKSVKFGFYSSLDCAWLATSIRLWLNWTKIFVVCRAFLIAISTICLGLVKQPLRMVLPLLLFAHIRAEFSLFAVEEALNIGAFTYFDMVDEVIGHLLEKPGGVLEGIRVNRLCRLEHIGVWDRSRGSTWLHLRERHIPLVVNDIRLRRLVHVANQLVVVPMVANHGAQDALDLVIDELI